MDSNGRLRLRFDDDGDGTGQLVIQASANGFSDEGNAWFANEEIKEFADMMGMFPFPVEKHPLLQGGNWKQDGSGEIDGEFLAVSVYPIDTRGHFGVQVRIATDNLVGTRPEVQHMVRLEFTTSYQPLARFSIELKALIEGRRQEAILEGDLA